MLNAHLDDIIAKIYCSLDFNRNYIIIYTFKLATMIAIFFSLFISIIRIDRNLQL